ncbi:MAG: hypothetical protein K2K72_05380 [Duncaniella sp.]|nr:hypothetical protein [Duncaniella sp.]
MDHSASPVRDNSVPAGFPFPPRREEQASKPGREAKMPSMASRQAALTENEGVSVENTDRALEEHYARWRRAVIDSTIITPLQ